MRCTALMFSIMVAAVGCKGKDESKTAPSTSSPPTTGDTAGSAAAPAPTPAPAEKIDICSFASKADVEAVLGALSSDPSPMQPQGSLLAGCDYIAKDAMGNASARPADELEATVKASSPSEEVSGIGKRAWSTSSGVMIEIEGARYFLHVLVSTMKGIDKDKSIALAKVIAPGAK